MGIQKEEIEGTGQGTSRKVHLKEQMYKPWRLEGQISGNLQFFCEIEEKGAA